MKEKFITIIITTWCTWTTSNVDFFKEFTKPKESVKKEKKTLTLKNAIIFLNKSQKIFNSFESGKLPRGKQEKDLQIL